MRLRPMSVRLVLLLSMFVQSLLQRPELLLLPFSLSPGMLLLQRSFRIRFGVP